MKNFGNNFDYNVFKVSFHWWTSLNDCNMNSYLKWNPSLYITRNDWVLLLTIHISLFAGFFIPGFFLEETKYACISFLYIIYFFCNGEHFIFIPKSRKYDMTSYFKQCSQMFDHVLLVPVCFKYFIRNLQHSMLRNVNKEHELATQSFSMHTLGLKVNKYLLIIRQSHLLPIRYYLMNK